MPIGIGFSSGMDAAILPPREHACKLIEVTLTEGKAFQSEEMVPQLKWVFEAVSWKSEDGKPGIITLWTGVRYGDPKAKLTALLDGFFGRSLTGPEAARLDMEKFVGAIKGYVMVLAHKKQDGTMTSKYGGFRWPDGKVSPTPSDFFLDPSAMLSSNPATSRPAPKRDVPDLDDGDDFGDLEDPFEKN